ncbi:aminotransferase class I/II-fold pyridoxal phosphate-dependent enzyme [Foetidibacter luteolus]|uniref:aminotransferase class I/II-fold pyridoxal phosphate-dependent enzyme n=1 Tax=Foetidibacter luteolus TaxID=2608880 RepID=UPI00129B7224|nr:8-amino-7-oxononanoate synthase [Foetidibacter luteolus]
MYSDNFLDTKLNERRQQNALRRLRLPEGKVDFCSNDYLGIVKNKLVALTGEELQLPGGSTGSRLLAGNYPLLEETEQLIAGFHKADAALIYNSGYDANVGVLSCVPQRGDTVLYDALAHASIRDGIRLSFARSFSFAHNNLAELETQLKQAAGNVFVVTESVFSMDGDVCPLIEIVKLCRQYHAHLIIDEAHATGVVGERGEGLVQQLHLQQQVFCRIHTFGKAVGCHGAVVLGSCKLREYLINFSRSLVYSTSLPPVSVAHIAKAYAIFPGLHAQRLHLRQLVEKFQHAHIAFDKFTSFTPIQVVMVPGNDEVKQLANRLQSANLDVRPILYPTVPKGMERLRIVLHAFNSFGELDLLIEILGVK